MYCQIRLEDINKLKNDIKINGIEITDEMSFFQGDGPASQFVAGHQKGGNYFCWVCELEADNCSDYVYSLSRPCVHECCRRSDARYLKYFDS